MFVPSKRDQSIYIDNRRQIVMGTVADLKKHFSLKLLQYKADSNYAAIYSTMNVKFFDTIEEALRNA